MEIAVLCLTFVALDLGSFTLAAGPVVNTLCGPVRGLVQNSAFSFRGIPFAKPPLGDLRWRPPQPLSQTDGSCWSGTYQAKTFGSQCVQRGYRSIIGDEDCLFLNVWTPTVDRSAGLPVHVLIHGGSLQFGSGNQELNSPSEALAAQTGVVYVAMNYRLHVFGFMALQILADDSTTKTSGNYGLMDQILALHWVQDNIHNFGGDPSQVTLSGQSSGGTSLFALLGSPLCKGLFHRATVISASPILNMTASDAFRDNLVFLKNTPCRNVSCLRLMSAEDLTRAVPWDYYPYWSMKDQLGLPVPGLFDGGIAIVDGHVLPEPPFEAWSSGRGIDVPLIVGTTAQEADLRPTPGGMQTWSWGDYEETVRVKLGAFDDFTANMALKLYPAGVISPQYQYTSMVSDVRVNCATNYLTYIASTSFKSPVYRYVATYIPSKPALGLRKGNPSRYAFHVLDFSASLGKIHTLILNPSMADNAFQYNMMKEIVSFVKTGRPASSSWGVYPGHTALLSQTTSATDAYHGSQCMFWFNSGLVSYSWVN